eukprot:532503_1
MTADAKHYVNDVLEYIKNSSKISTVQLEKITFKSKQQRDRKENSTLRQLLLSQQAKSFTQYHWTIKYQFLMENTHNLIFTNNNISDFSSIGSKSIDIALQQSRSVDVDDDKLNEDEEEFDQSFSFSIRTAVDELLPSYFMQISFIDEDGFHIQISCDQITENKRKFFIKELHYNKHSKIYPIERRVKIEKGQNKGEVDIDIHENHKELHYLALYDSRKATEPLPNSMQLQFVVLKDENEYPPQNAYYKPNSIDLSTILQIKDETNMKLDIYWLIPSRSFGSISYKIIKDDIESKGEQVIKSLPYSIPFEMTPISFQVITITKINDHIYESDPSESIIIESMSPVKSINDHEEETKIQWRCTICTYLNDGGLKCTMCGISQDKMDEEMFDKTNQENARVFNDAWTCNICTMLNSGKDERCLACNAERSTDTSFNPNSIDSMNMNTYNSPYMNLNSMAMNTNTQSNQSFQPPSFNSNSMNFQPQQSAKNLFGGNVITLQKVTKEDFIQAASDIATYNENPGSVFSTLRSVAKKLLKDDVRYRTLDTTNPKVSERLIGYEGVVDFLTLLGFESDVMGMK